MVTNKKNRKNLKEFPVNVVITEFDATKKVVKTLINFALYDDKNYLTTIIYTYVNNQLFLAVKSKKKKNMDISIIT